MNARSCLAAAAFAVIVLASLNARAASPSFDCAKAGNWAEKQICKNDELAALDGWFGPLYGQVLQRLSKAEADALRSQRKEWIKTRNACKDDADGTACVKKRYQEFTAELELKFAELVESSVAAQFAKSPIVKCLVGPPDCLERLLETEETNLADAEAKAGDTAAQRDQADQNAAAADRLAEANVAWRAYRNAECKRRQVRYGSADLAGDYSSCLVELTRARARELQM